MIQRLVFFLSSLLFGYYIADGAALAWAPEPVAPLHIWYLFIALLGFCSSAYCLSRIGAARGWILFLAISFIGFLARPHVSLALESGTAFNPVEAGLAQAMAACSAGTCGRTSIGLGARRFLSTEGPVDIQTTLVPSKGGCRVVASIAFGDENNDLKRIPYLEYASARQKAISHFSLWFFDLLFSNVVLEEEYFFECPSVDSPTADTPGMPTDEDHSDNR